MVKRSTKIGYLNLPGDDHDLRTELAELGGHPLAEPGAAARHEDHLPLERVGRQHRPLLRREVDRLRARLYLQSGYVLDYYLIVVL